MEEIEKLSNEKACEALKKAIENLYNELEIDLEVRKDIEKCDSKEKLFSYWNFLRNMKISRESMRITDDLLKICKEV